MKKLPFYSIILGTLTLVSCSEYGISIPQTLETKEFYLENEEKANKVIEQCRQFNEKFDDVAGTLKKEERKEFWQYVKANRRNFDSNCENAREALYDIKQQKRQEEREREEQKRQEERKRKEEEQKAKQAGFEKEVMEYVQTLKNSYASATWQESLTKLVNSNQLRLDSEQYIDGLIYSDGYKGVSSDDYLSTFRGCIESDSGCKHRFEQGKSDVLNSIYLEYRFIGAQELQKKAYKDLMNDTSYCKTDRREHSVCSVWLGAVAHKKAETINDYVTNYEKLKTDYNQCVVKLENYLTSINVGKNDEVSWQVKDQISKAEKDIYSQYPCLETEAALRKLNLTVNHYEKLN